MQFNQFTGIIHQSRQIARRKAGQSKRRNYMNFLSGQDGCGWFAGHVARMHRD